MEVLRIMKRLCGLYATLDFQFEIVLFEELNRQLVSVYLKREAVEALRNEMGFAISRKKRLDSDSKTTHFSTRIEDLVSSLKLEDQSGSGSRVQAGALQLQSRPRANARPGPRVGPQKVPLTRHQFGGTLFSLVSSKNYKSTEQRR